VPHVEAVANDSALLRRAAGIIRDWHHRTMIRAATRRGTAQVLCWQSSDLRSASVRIVTQAERLVARSEAAARGSPERGSMTDEVRE
jgi:hypothetical protein